MTDEQLLAYMGTMAQHRLDRMNVALSKLTERERRLMREVAVMAYVQGQRNPDDSEDHPKDSEVFHGVVMAMQSMPDMYPILEFLTNGEKTVNEEREEEK